jgi:hypothetical protein
MESLVLTVSLLGNVGFLVCIITLRKRLRQTNATAVQTLSTIIVDLKASGHHEAVARIIKLRDKM